MSNIILSMLFIVLFLNCFTMMIYKDIFGLKKDKNFWWVHSSATGFILFIMLMTKVLCK